MHNCKTTLERLTELLLDGSDPRVLLATELRECAECRGEFRVLKETLGLTTRAIETATPPDNYWPRYHARLKEKLHAAQQPRFEPGQYQEHANRPSWLKRFFVASIRVPVPVGLALLFVLGLFIVKLQTRVPSEPVIVRVPVEVPVVQEKTVERVVYRERSSKPQKQRPATPKNEAAVASLEGFTPAEEVKLTVIKGGSGNEK